MPTLSLLHRPVVGENPHRRPRRQSVLLGDKNVKDAARFSRLTSDIYLVTRLDGFTVDDVIKLIDRGAAPSTTANRARSEGHGASIAAATRGWPSAAARLAAMNQAPAVQLESTRAVASTDGPGARLFLLGLERSGQSAAGHGPAVRQRRHRRHVREHRRPHVSRAAGDVATGRRRAARRAASRWSAI